MYTKFDKKIFCHAVKECMNRLGVTRKEIAKELNIHIKTVGLYLNENANETPKINQVITLHQLLQTSLTNLLMGRGPKFIDPKSSRRLDDMTRYYADPNKPAYFLINVLLQSLDYATVEQIAGHIELYIKHNHPTNSLAPQRHA